MMDWQEINTWRKARRVELRQHRLALSPAERKPLWEKIGQTVEAAFPELEAAELGFYWPFRGEVDPLPLVRRLVARGARAALPVVVDRHGPVEFWAWRPGQKLVPGVWDIPVPAEREPLQPTALLAPLLGFDRRGYRLGNGGGYYDRTLAALEPRPFAIGIGLELGRLDTIHPQPHDVPMDAIVTEAGLYWPPVSADGAPGDPEPSSPVCYAREADPGYFGFLSEPEVRDLLDGLLADARAWARTAAACGQEQPLPEVLAPLDALRTQESRFCALLTRRMRRLGGEPTRATGPAHDRALRVAGLADRLAYLARGLAEGAGDLERTLPRLRDERLYEELLAMQAALASHAERLAALSGRPGGAAGSGKARPAPAAGRGK
jgi:5-formyltetrahydrofolate cyclo-ligase